jgi:predicted nucleotidyltransferase
VLFSGRVRGASINPVDRGSPISAELRALLTSKLPTDGRVRLAVLFGSAARGRLQPGSDLDVALLPAAAASASGPPWSDDDDLALQSTLTLAAGREVDLVRLDQASTILKWQIASAALPLLEDRPGELARFRAHAASEYADFAPSYQRYAEIFRKRLIARAIAT